MPAIKVFIGGSRAVVRLNDALRTRFDRIIAEGHEVLIGDANGADRIVQQYFADHQYRAVTIYCTGSRCRNNVGQWTTNPVAPPGNAHGGFDFYAAKDREMAADATHGLMLWDGKSRGTFTNITNLVSHNKPVVVYMSPTKSFINVKAPADVDSLTAQAATVSGPRDERRRV